MEEPDTHDYKLEYEKCSAINSEFRFWVWEKAVCYRTTDFISSSSTYFKHGQASDFEI
jgi:hypothetical protein